LMQFDSDGWRHLLARRCWIWRRTIV
jgi:hypothetical protein